jgi:hypothetical protein
VEVRVLERCLVLEQVRVHGPEVRLRASSFSGRRGCARAWMDLLQWKVPKDESQVLWELTLKLMHGMARQSRVRTFVIAVLYKRYDRVSTTLRVIVSRNGVRQPTGGHRRPPRVD